MDISSVLRLCFSCSEIDMGDITMKITQKPVMALFGATISERRKMLSINQKTLAEHVGISQASLSRIEKGSIAPRFERLQLFADALKCSISDLFLVRREASEWAATIEKIISPLSDHEQRGVVEFVAKITALIAARRPGKAA